VVSVCTGHGCRIADLEVAAGDRNIPVRLFHPDDPALVF